MAEIVALLDANVIYPASLRDFLLSLAEVNLFDPRWSAEIQREWIDNLLEDRTDLQRRQLNRTQRLMNEAFPEANVSGYEHLIPQLDLPDPNDRHVLAAAIHADATFIVSFNAQDFPPEALEPFEVQLANPDAFVVLLIAIDAEAVLTAFAEQLGRLKNPPQTAEQLLMTLEINGLIQSVEMIRDAITA